MSLVLLKSVTLARAGVLHPIYKSTVAIAFDFAAERIRVGRRSARPQPRLGLKRVWRRKENENQLLARRKHVWEKVDTRGLTKWTHSPSESYIYNHTGYLVQLWAISTVCVVRNLGKSRYMSMTAHIRGARSRLYRSRDVGYMLARFRSFSLTKLDTFCNSYLYLTNLSRI